jgi:hypothetical protein
MVTWAEFTGEVPEFAAYVEGKLLGRKFLVMATIRAVGAPRVSGTEIIVKDGDLWLGGMTNARRWADLRRDPRIAIHCGQDDEATWRGDAKIAGVAVEVTDPAVLAGFAGEGGEGGGPPQMELFRIDVQEATAVRLEGEPPVALLVESWRPGAGVTTVRRD